MLEGLLLVRARGSEPLVATEPQVLPAPRTSYSSPFDSPGISVWLVLQLSSEAVTRMTALPPGARRQGPLEQGCMQHRLRHVCSSFRSAVFVAATMPVRSSSCCQPLESAAKVGAAFTPLPYRCAPSWAAQLAPPSRCPCLPTR